MSADILSDPNHPHGTTEGLRLGCRTVHCPAPVSCREVHYLYQGDFAFRRAIDAGLTPTEAIEAAKAKATRPETPTRPVKPIQSAPKVRAPRVREPSQYEERLRALHAEGKFDTEIADELGIRRRQVTNIRDSLKLPAHRGIDPEAVRKLHADGLSDRAIAAALNKERQRPIHRKSIYGVRHRLGLKANRTPATAGVSSS